MRMTPVDQTKARMGYQSANRRPSCHNCYHAKEAERSGAYNDVWRWRCTKGGFGVTAQAVCGEHQPVKQEGGAI